MAGSSVIRIPELAKVLQRAHEKVCRVSHVGNANPESERDTDRFETGHDIRRALSAMRGLVVEAVVIFVEAAVLEHGNSLAQRALEFKNTRELLIEAFGLFHALDIGSKRFGQIDCGEHLHDRTYDVPTDLGRPPFQLVTFVTRVSLICEGMFRIVELK
jgi:hypothetical protein